MRPEVDAVVVGSGHNGLVAAAYLAKAGWGVEVLEANPAPGGAVATEDLTLPGYHHDTFSSWHPLFHLSAAYAELGKDLAARGLAYANADDLVTAAVGDDRAPVVLHRDQTITAAGLGEEDGPTYLQDLRAFSTHGAAIGRLMGAELRSWETLAQVARLGYRLGWRASLDVGAQAVASARAWLREGYRTSAVEDLLSPWILHTGLTPDDAGGQLQLRALASALHQVGLPVVRGGSANFVDALVRLIEDHGGKVRTGVAVDRVLVEGGRAVGVRTGAGELGASRAVIANVTPTQLYQHLLPREVVPAAALGQAGRYRYNPRAGAQIHLALSEPARWREDRRLDHTPLVHVGAGLDGTALACAQASAGLLPARPTIVCGQPTVLDPSRAPEGGAILWIQLQEVPSVPRGDAAGELDVADGRWTPGLGDAYADRVISLLATHVENLPGAIRGRSVITPADLARRNRNLVGGDLYAGATDLSQFYLFRPLPGYGSHATPIPRLYQCGASTHPGPGLNAASGRIVARRLLGRTRSGRTGHHEPRR